MNLQNKSLDTPPAITGNPPVPNNRLGSIDGFTFPNLSICKKPRDAASMIPPSKLENMSGMVERANAPMANPKSFPDKATPPHGPDSITVIIIFMMFSSAAIDEINAGIPIPKFTNTGARFIVKRLMNSSATLLAIILSYCFVVPEEYLHLNYYA